MNIEALKQLKRVVKNAPAIDMSLWCGTPCCAAGNALNDPWFLGQGLFRDDAGPAFVAGCEIEYGYDALATFFGLNKVASLYLFDPDWYDRIDSKAEVLKHIDKVIKDQI